ncbi:MAG: 3-carboxy-cis,cis-muconate cycloisomerase [Hoeflea sp.]|uniref:3-carboxy-cis,cis-muconate cycloisomerase n=1 Tax=Hoeflea sp. TaxID=1940281 RepID=UPI001DB5C55B|nr:3-carboxy-cis,cis-muconate cycloisomerase [Hoeflea sp.]MBU4528320.1 3-carboxy-cis,cis-muconate cycloisomerase [Alphaproteobacteria bacterium]MBU4542989.1 3-carboxy-cis,cis-muconate cycloisomerase [Alphaproteobacteria bacterium]MBU4551680.1 3-carboxy-cis,cis-muconate cycloisomerase [Alphaproteobacteria bacterium]MBV1723575.1 3-carboxy-cis,cis-muconate cycloisomerase [Hoeflea sp.]MBV1761891.1 3-carboxy-cis,cis-muconate cycloisomerase [Hoeflea sp.]
MEAGAQGWMSPLFSDREITEQFSDTALFASFARFEQALIKGLAQAKMIGSADAAALIDQIAAFRPDHAAIAEATIRDGVPAPDYVRQLRAHVTGPGSDLVHHGATSQDLVDTATIEALGKTSVILAKRLDEVLARLANLVARDGTNRLQAITRMQPALAFEASDRLAAWQQPLEDLRGRMTKLREQTRILQFGGAVGDLQALGDNAAIIAETLARDLDLRWPGQSWHSARGPMIAHANFLSELTGALGKIGQDVALMALRGDDDIRLSGGGSSSAMPHKHNPVTAERLVTLARFNATLICGMHQAQIHEMERSGAAWMLEWMILPQMCQTAGASLTAASALVGSIHRIGASKGDER